LYLLQFGYITGIIWGLYLKSSIALIFFLILIGGIVLVKINIINLNQIEKYKRYIFLFVVFMLISYIKITNLENKFDNLYNGISKTNIIGTIITNEEETEYKKVYTIKVESINNNNKYKGTNLILYTSKKAEFEYGDLVTISGIYEKASTRTNYKAFDYREYLKQKNIYGIVNLEEGYVIKKNNMNHIFIVFNKIKVKIKTNLKYMLAEEASLANRYFTSEIFLRYQKT